MDICRDNGIGSATFSGIGGCEDADIMVFNAEKGTFEPERIEGALELISVMGNITTDEEMNYFHHTHAMFSYFKGGEHHISAGHMKATRVLYTAEIELRPVTGGRLGHKYHPETGTGFWTL